MPSGHHRTTLSGHISATKACIDNREKFVKQQYLFHISSQYGELCPLTAEIVWWVWGTPANFNGFPLMDAGCNNMQDYSTDPAARTVAAFTSNNRMSSPVNKEHLPFIDAEQGGQWLFDISGLLSAWWQFLWQLIRHCWSCDCLNEATLPVIRISQPVSRASRISTRAVSWISRRLGADYQKECFEWQNW